jgi:hypothetical protein
MKHSTWARVFVSLLDDTKLDTLIGDDPNLRDAKQTIKEQIPHVGIQSMLEIWLSPDPFVTSEDPPGDEDSGLVPTHDAWMSPIAVASVVKFARAGNTNPTERSRKVDLVSRYTKAFQKAQPGRSEELIALNDALAQLSTERPRSVRLDGGGIGSG